MNKSICRVVIIVLVVINIILLFLYTTDTDKMPNRLPISPENKNYCFDNVEVIVLPENGVIDTAESF